MATFTWNGLTLAYFNHSYNHTALNMRCVEIPVVRWFLGQCGEGARILEVGNVLSHYGPVTWPVVDLYEKGAINADVMCWEPQEPVDLLISISTIEHIGFGKYKKTTAPTRPSLVLARFRSFLAEGGQAVVTAPAGYNPVLDAELSAGTLGADRTWFMRVTERRMWHECTMEQALAMSARACAGRWSGGLVVLRLDADFLDADERG